MREPRLSATQPPSGNVGISLPVTPLRAWTLQERALLQSRLQALWLDWWSDWWSDLVPPNPMDGSLSGFDVRTVRVVSPDDSPVVPALDSNTAVPQALEALTFPDTRQEYFPMPTASGGRIVDQLLRQAWAAWCEALRSCLGWDGSLKTVNDALWPTASWQPWSGSLYVGFPIGNADWGLALNAATVSHVLGSSYSLSDPGPASPSHGSPSSLVPVAQALSGHSVRLHVVLQPIRLSVGQLQSLVPGDVITLPQRLGQTAEIFLDPSDPGGSRSDLTWQRLGLAALGQVRGQRAVECLTPSAH